MIPSSEQVTDGNESLLIWFDKFISTQTYFQTE
jgi:hypothetical protein